MMTLVMYSAAATSLMLFRPEPLSIAYLNLRHLEELMDDELNALALLFGYYLPDNIEAAIEKHGYGLLAKLKEHFLNG